MFRTMILFVGLIATTPAAAQTVTVDFENLAPTRPNPTGTGFYENGKNLTPPASTFTSGGATFNNRYQEFSDGQGGVFESWSGWSYSTVKDTTTSGFMNQYAAYVQPTPAGGAGASGSATYAVAFAGAPTIALPENYRPDSIKITNTTYAALVVQDGNQFAKKFGGVSGNDEDFFKVTIKGFAADGTTATGSKEFYLADYRFADTMQDYIISDWTTVNLSDLGSATRRLAFEFASSDVHPQFGINTPVYFAADDLTASFVAPVPEPATTGLVAAAAVAFGWRRWRR